MARLSVNLNKVATLRNSRGGSEPCLLDAVDVCLAAGATGITLHPRADERHVRRRDVFEVAERLAPLRETIELNLEGDPRPDWVELVRAVRPQQATLVPVTPGEITSHAGFSPDTDRDATRATIAALREAGARVSVFVDPVREAIAWAADVGADRVELYTEPYARAFERAEHAGAFARYRDAATYAHELGLGVNAGHDLDLENLVLFRTLPFLDEVSIGHAIISRAVFHGLHHVVREYLSLLAD